MKWNMLLDLERGGVERVVRRENLESKVSESNVMSVT